jgi:hypothetical protein
MVEPAAVKSAPTAMEPTEAAAVKSTTTAMKATTASAMCSIGYLRQEYRAGTE